MLGRPGAALAESGRTPKGVILGFNPFRPHRKSTADLIMVVLALAATVAVVVWAIFPQ